MATVSTSEALEAALISGGYININPSGGPYLISPVTMNNPAFVEGNGVTIQFEEDTMPLGDIPSNSNCFAAYAAVRLNNLTIVAGGHYAGFLAQESGCILRNVTITDYGFKGISVSLNQLDAWFEAHDCHAESDRGNTIADPDPNKINPQPYLVDQSPGVQGGSVKFINCTAGAHPNSASGGSIKIATIRKAEIVGYRDTSLPFDSINSQGLIFAEDVDDVVLRDCVFPNAVAWFPDPLGSSIKVGNIRFYDCIIGDPTPGDTERTTQNTTAIHLVHVPKCENLEFHNCVFKNIDRSAVNDSALDYPLADTDIRLFNNCTFISPGRDDLTTEPQFYFEDETLPDVPDIRWTGEITRLYYDSRIPEGGELRVSSQERVTNKINLPTSTVIQYSGAISDYQSTFETALASYDIVTLGPGTFPSSSFTIPEDKTLLGCNEDTVTISGINGNSNSYVVTLEDNTRIGFMTVDRGNHEGSVRAGLDPADGTIAGSNGIDTFKIEDMTFTGSIGTATLADLKAVDVNQGSSNGIIKNCSITNGELGIYVSRFCSNITIDNNTINDIQGQHGIYCQQVDGLYITNNTIDNTFYQGIKSQLDALTAAESQIPDDVIIEGNTISNTGDNAINISTTSDVRTDQGAGYIRHNKVTIRNNTATNNITGVGIRIVGADEVKLDNNDINGSYNIEDVIYRYNKYANIPFNENWESLNSWDVVETNATITASNNLVTYVNTNSGGSLTGPINLPLDETYVVEATITPDAGVGHKFRFSLEDYNGSTIYSFLSFENGALIADDGDGLSTTDITPGGYVDNDTHIGIMEVNPNTLSCRFGLKINGVNTYYHTQSIADKPNRISFYTGGTGGTSTIGAVKVRIA